MANITDTVTELRRDRDEKQRLIKLGESILNGSMPIVTPLPPLTEKTYKS